MRRATLPGEAGLPGQKAARAAHVVAGHTRHTVLFALVAGLLAGGWLPAAAPVLAAGVTVALLRLTGRAALASGAAAALLAGAALADARRDAIDHGPLPAAIGAPLHGPVVLLEPAHRRASGEVVARVRLAGGPARGESVLARAGDWAGAASADAPAAVLRSAPVGAILDVRGRLVTLRPFDELQRRRGALAAVVVGTLRDTGRRRGGVAGVLDGVRERARLGMAEGLRPAQAALAHGMVLGDDAAIAADVREDFQRSGLAHLLAASGSNVMLLATLVLAIGALLGTPLRPRLAAALVLVAAYVPLAGGGPSIQRAGVMGAAGLVAALAGRPASRWYAIGLAATLSLALNPYAAAEPGWQLSFAAVLGLVVLGPRLGRLLSRPSIPGALTEAAAMTVAATIATAPLLALHFERVSLASLPANVLAAPAVAPLMWLGTLAGVAGQIAPALAVPFNALNVHLLGFMTWLAHASAALPAASLPVRVPGAAGVVAAYAALAAAALGAGRVRRSLREGAASGHRASGADARAGRAGHFATGPALALLAVLALVGLSLASGRSVPPLRPGETAVSFLDIGQGDATLIQRDGASVLFDTGPPDGPILQRLHEAGMRRLDVLVITHAQADHEGGALSVARVFRPRVVVDGGAGWPTHVQQRLRAAAGRAAKIVIPEAGQRVRVGALDIRILWPPRAIMRAPPSGDPNDRAVVAHLRSDDFDMLLPADAESNVQAALPLPRVDVLKVAHHGSADAGLPAVLDRLHPAVATIEVGRHNTYGHPTPSTLAALRAVPRLYRTDRDGTVRLRVFRGKILVDSAGGGLR